MRKKLSFFNAVFVALLLPFISFTQISISSFNAVTENFNSLAASGSSSSVPSGWFFVENTGNINYTAGTGSSTTGDTYSYGAASNPDRAFGELTTGSFSSTIGASFTNNTGTTITNLTISYYGEQWRLGALGREDKLDFQYSTNSTLLTNGTWTDVNYLDFGSPVAAGGVGLLDGNLAANRTLIKFTITNLAIPNGATFWIRWRSIDASGSDDGLAIDDFSIQAVPSAIANGEALDFGGTADRVSLGDLGNVNDWTIETWFRPNGVINYENLFHSDDEGMNNGIRMELSTNFGGGKLYIYLNGTQHNIVLSNELLTNAWHHVAVVGDRTNNKLYAYFNGVKKLDVVRTTWFNSLPDFVLGRGHNSAADRDYNGRLDEFRIWNRALSQAEITSQKDVSLSGAEGSLLAYYDFNQGTANENNSGVITLPDRTPNDHDGTLIDFTLIGSSSNWVSQGAPVQSIPSLFVDDVSVTEGNSGPRTLTFTVGLSSPAGAGGVTFDIATANNTATSANSDYVAKSLTGQTIPAGSSTYAFEVTVNGDFTIEPDESFFVNLTNITGANVGDGQGLGTIQNDDVLLVYYPRAGATNLSLVSNWTDNVSGISGSSPADFTSPNQQFNLNDNVTNPTVGGGWTFGNGSNLVLNNSTPLTFTSAANLKINTGSTVDFNNKSVVLQSTSAGTAYIGNIEGLLAGATNVTVERYISSLNNRAYRLLAPSVNTTTTIRQNWQEAGSNVPGIGTHITGSTTGANGFDATQTGQSSLFTLDPVSFAWQPAANTNATTLNAKEGYLLYIRGDRTLNLNTTTQPLPSNNTTLRATGSLLIGPQSFTGLYGAGEFNLVTNPYASPINWNSVRSSSSNLASSYTLWDPNIGEQGAYVTVNSMGIASNNDSKANLNIQSGQAFFVQATPSSLSATVNILEAHKSASSNLDVFRVGSQTEMFSSTLYYTNANGVRINADGVTSVYSNNYAAAVDDDDAVQMANWDEDVAISRAGNSLSIEGRPLIDQHDTIPFILSRLQQRTYEWQFIPSNFNHPNLQAALVDNFQGTRIPISLNAATVISFTVTSNPASSASNRFMVVFSPVVGLPVHLTSVKAYQKGQDIQVEWTTQSEINMAGYEVEKSTDARQFTKIANLMAMGGNSSIQYHWLDQQAVSGANYYRIKAVGNGGEVQYSKIVRVNMGKASNELNVYPNPFNGNTIGIGMNLPKGIYTVSLVNAVGQRVFQQQLNHLGGAATQSITLDRALANGIYRLTIANGEETFVQTITKQ